MNDLKTCVRGGTIQTPDGAYRADVLVAGERVTALVEPGEQVGADHEIDATGLWVMPGLIDLHAHTRVPGYEYKEDYVTASRAAAVGGVTTFVDMPNVEPPTTTLELLHEKREQADQDSIIDFGHFVAPTVADQILPMAEAGAAGYKIFQVKGGYPHDPRLAIDDPGQLLATFRAVEQTGLPCVVHPFAQAVFEELSEEAFAAGRPRDIWTFSDVYTRDVVWRSAVGILLDLQRETGVRLHLVHTHAAGSLRLIREAKREGLRVTAACDPKYIHLRDVDMDQQGARAIPGGFVTNDEERMNEVWRSLDDGTLDIIDSDHAPHTLGDLTLMEKDPWTGPFGAPHYDHYLSLLLTDVHEGRLRLERLIELVSASPAKILGLYPERGAILPGSLANLVLVDPEAEVKPQDDQMESKAGWTPYHGWNFRGGPVMTLLRGTVIAERGEIKVDNGFGRRIDGKSQR